jgi:hypothetical protein
MPMAKGSTVNTAMVIPFGKDDALIDYGNTGVLKPEGNYQAACRGHETAFTFGTPKLYFRFCIVEPGESFGKELFKAYRVKSLIGKPSRNGRVKLTANGDLAMMLYRVLRLQSRLDRVSLSIMRNRVFHVRVRTVKTDYRQRPRPEPLWYSVVDDILELAAGAI